MKWLWGAWLQRCERLEDARILAMIRIGVCACIVLDLLRLLQLDLVRVLFIPYSAGGLGRFQDTPWVLDHLHPVFGPMLAYVVTLVCFTMVGLGRHMRFAAIVGCLAFAQLGHGFPGGDKGIDRMLRAVVLILAFSKADQRWAWNNKPRVDHVSGWTFDLLRLELFICYTAAGLSKIIQQPKWLAWDGMPVLYRVMADPLSSDLDPVALHEWMGPLRVMGWGVILLETSSFLVFTRFRRYWACLGASMHLGIAWAMVLGMFSWGMLAQYPVLLNHWLVPWLDRLEQWWARRRPGPSGDVRPAGSADRPLSGAEE